MDTTLFLQILDRPESDTLDFKQTLYDFSGGDTKEIDKKRAKFVKDIISMKNTPRENDAYIVFGIKNNPDGTKECIGLTSQIDDAELQGKFSGWVHPHPRFRYEPISWDEKNFGIITIPPAREIGPCIPTVDKGPDLLRRNVVYHRRNSQNSEADQAEQKAIFRWFEHQELSIPRNTGNDPWDQFIEAVAGFSADRQYILILSRIERARGFPIENVGLVDWSFVLDFDPQSEIDGVLGACKGNLERRRTLHRVVKGDKPSLNPHSGTWWYFARGLSGRESTIPGEKRLEWHRMYGRDLRDQVENLAKTTSSRPTTIVAIIDTLDITEYLTAVFDALVSAFGDSAEFVIVSGDQDYAKGISLSYEAKNPSIPLKELFHGLGVLKRDNRIEGTSEHTLPSSSGAPIPISERDSLWLSEELEVIHREIGQRPKDGANPGTDFLRGSTISWYELGLRSDVERDIFERIKKQVRNMLSRRRTWRENLYHAPGAGGTTVARRLLWEFRNDYPCLILNRTSPKETAERLSHIYALTSLPILLCLDGSNISDRQSDELYEILAARQLPVIMFQVLRQSRSRVSMNEQRINFLDTSLTSVEVARFVYALSREAPQRKGALEQLTNNGRPSGYSPFYLALVTFGRDFTSLEKYIRTRIDELTSSQATILLYISLAHHYGQKSIPAQAFSRLLGIAPVRQVNLNELLPEATLELLLESGRGTWRTAHELIAEEVIQQILTPPSRDRRLWRQLLADKAVEFVSFLRGDLPTVTEDRLELARRVFVFRDNSELIGTERSSGSDFFAQLIGDIPAPEGRLRVLKALTEFFPDESHFWAHLGRFYSNTLRDYSQAETATAHSLLLSPRDHLLHHMKGMVIRNSVYELIEKGASIADVVERAKQASESFSEARTLQPEDSHGYISDAQMIVRVLDYVGKISKLPPPRAAANSPDVWTREAFQKAEDLLLQVRSIKQMESPSEYEQRCRASLDALYGKHEEALQIWSNLLTKDPRGHYVAFAPPIRRQIVWTYLARKERRWDKLTAKELTRSISLLEDNLREDPGDDRDTRLWMRAIRHSEHPPSLDNVIERVAYWRTTNNSLDSIYYLYVLHALQAIAGSRLSKEHAMRLIEECRERARGRRDRTRSFEWLGSGSELQQIVNQDQLGEWSKDAEFWSTPTLLRRVKGTIINIQPPVSGKIEVIGGLEAFFVPARSHFAGRSENQPVSFYLGFSYEGLRAWSVEDMPG